MHTPLRRGLAIASLCIIGALLAAFATNTSAPPPPTSVAIVDLAALTKNLDESKALSDQLTHQRDEFQKNLQSIKEELASVTKDLESMGKDKRGSTDYLKQLARKYELEASYKARGESSQQLLDIFEGDNMKSMFAKVTDTVARLGQERGYDLILWDDRTILPPPNPATGAQVWNIIRDRRILYAASRVDITNEVLLQMNNEYKAGKR